MAIDILKDIKQLEKDLKTLYRNCDSEKQTKHRKAVTEIMGWLRCMEENEEKK